MRQRSSQPKTRKAPAVASLEAEMLKRVRANGGLSRVELSRELKLVPSTAGIYVDRLIARGYLIESRKTERSLGRPPTMLTPNPTGGRFIGLDFEATHLRATCVDFSQRPLGQLHVDLRANDSTERIQRQIEGAIEKIAGGKFSDVLAIGVGVPGWIDPKHGVAIEYNFLPHWRNVPIGARLKKRFNVPVFIENNIRSMALAELWFGQGLGLQNFICVGTRAGIASGIIVNGQLLHGHNNFAGEIGFWSCPIAEPSTKGKGSGHATSWKWKAGDKLEAIASLSAIKQRIRDAIADGTKTSLAHLGREPEIPDFIDAVNDGDKFALQLLEFVAGVHGWVAQHLCHAFNPERIIFAGPLTALGDRFLGPAQRVVAELADRDSQTKITLTQLGEYNGALGAAALALHQWKPAR